MKNDYLLQKIQNLDDEAFVQIVGEITERSAVTNVKPKDGVVHVLSLSDELQEIRRTKHQFRGLSTGYTTLDAKMGGLEKGSVTLFAGETSNGKSALATNVAVNIAKTGTGVLYISLEMTRRQMIERLDAIAGDEWEAMNLLLQESFDLDYKSLEPLLKNAKELGGVEMVVLDYLQYLGRGMNLEEVAKMSKTIKSLALKYDIAFLVIVSLRKGDGKFKRQWKDIEVEDLMGTSAIGYDADTAIVVSRKDLENEFRDENIYVKVLKTRNTKLDYNDRILQFIWDKLRITEEWKV